MTRNARSARPNPLAALVLAALAFSGPASALTFTEEAAAAGITFRHAATDDGGPILYPETNGSGACWGDVDLDGVEDLFLVNGLYSDGDLQAAFDPRSALYLNDGDGTFTDASAAWGVDLSGWYQGCSLADYDGDGDPDLLVVGYDLIALLRNERDRFVDATAAAGLTMAGKCGDLRCFGETGSWADYDGDGDLDLYVTNMVDYDVDLNKNDPVSPTLYNGQPNVLWRNRGDGTFEDVTAAAGVGDNPGPDHSKSFQGIWADYDRDGDPDLYIASDTTPNTLFRNNGDGTFTDVAFAAGVDDPRSSMGLVFQDVDRDGRPDLFMTHYAAEQNGFYVNRGDGTFRDRSGEGELNNIENISWGAGFHDLDHDGDTDIYAIAGHTSPQIGMMDQKARLWFQRDDGTFDDVRAESGPAFNLSFAGRGSAAADYDLDGDLDLAIVAMYNQTAKLFRNSGATGHWLQVEVRQGGMNRFAIGAEVTVTPEGGAPVVRIVQAGNSFLSQDSIVVHAGLGAATQAAVQVRWPDGAVEQWTGVGADQRVRLTRGVPAVQGDTLAPRTTLALAGEGRNGWYRGPVTVTLAAQDKALGTPSGVEATEARPDRGAAWAPYAGPFVLSAEGRHEAAGRSRDHAGNVEPARVSVVRIDTTPPATSALVHGPEGPGGWYARTAFVGFAATDALSGVEAVWSRVDGGPWLPGTMRRIDGDGVHVVEFYAEDLAGNVEAVQSLSVGVDSTPPAVQLRSWPLALALAGGRLEVDAGDDLSGVEQVAFFLGSEAAPRFVDRDGADGWSWTVSAAPGVHRVRAVATNGAGVSAADEGLLAAAPLAPPPLALVLLGAAPLAGVAGARRPR